LLINEERWRWLLDDRAARPDRVFELAANRRRRPLLGEDGRLVIIAADHAARRILGVGDDRWAMADRRRLLERIIVALRRPGVDGLLATPDIFEDLLRLGELDGHLVFGSMNRGGLTGSSWELDDRFTAFDAPTIAAMGLDGGKMLLRIDDTDPGSNQTMVACAGAVGALAAERLVAMVEPLPARRDPDGRVRVVNDPDLLVEAVAVASALGPVSAYTWLKLPAPAEPERVLAATSLPCLLLGGDPGERSEELMASWEAAMALPQVRGLVAGRSLLYPPDGDVAAVVDRAVAVVRGKK
jgi:DhnA family fructose-bisphosphate aldolase class Ia